jgi:hypothetical protein
MNGWNGQKIPMVLSNGVASVFKARVSNTQAYSPT